MKAKCKADLVDVKQWDRESIGNDVFFFLFLLQFFYRILSLLYKMFMGFLFITITNRH